MRTSIETKVGLCMAAYVALMGYVASETTEKPSEYKPVKFEMAVIGYIDKQTGTLSYSEPVDFETAFVSKMPSFSKKLVSTDLEVAGLFLSGTREYESAIQKRVEASIAVWKRIDPVGRPKLPVEILNGDSYATATSK